MLPIPDKKIIRLYSLTWVIGYLLVYFIFREFLPSKSLTDALYIQEIIAGQMKDAPSKGFELMARLYSFFPQQVTWSIVGLINAFVLYKIAAKVKTFRSMAIMPLVMLPFIGLNLQAPTKETMVILIGLWIYALADKIKSENKFILVIGLIYSMYGLFVREYYALIFGVFVFYVILLRSPILIRWAYTFPVLLFFLLLPESAYHYVGDARNSVNSLVNFGEASEVRTYFMNPYISDNLLHFTGNYLNAFAILHFPFLKAITPKEIGLFINIVIYWTLMINGIKNMQGTARLLSILFASHITVLTIFEPDYGSYFRHFSSVIIYLLPSMAQLDNRWAAFLVAKHKSSSIHAHLA